MRNEEEDGWLVRARERGQVDKGMEKGGRWVSVGKR